MPSRTGFREAESDCLPAVVKVESAAVTALWQIRAPVIIDLKWPINTIKRWRSLPLKTKRQFGKRTPTDRANAEKNLIRLPHRALQIFSAPTGPEFPAFPPYYSSPASGTGILRQAISPVTPTMRGSRN